MSALPPDIDQWDRERLIDFWRSAFGQNPPSHLRTDFMRLAVAWQIQVGTKPGKPGKRPSVSKAGGRQLLAEGSHLVREWQGKTHKVTVLPSGYDYAGRTYRSLSAIARAITGTPWSGPAFFGIGR